MSVRATEPEGQEGMLINDTFRWSDVQKRLTPCALVATGARDEQTPGAETSGLLGTRLTAAVRAGPSGGVVAVLSRGVEHPDQLRGEQVGRGQAVTGPESGWPAKVVNGWAGSAAFREENSRGPFDLLNLPDR